MARTTAFTKRSLINKANSTMVIATTVAAFALVFGLVAGKALVSQMGYQNRVVSAKKIALNRLKGDLAARTTLKNSYDNFVAQNPNVIAGDKNGTGSKDGDNAQIVLDALPSKYDFPGLTTSLEKLITDQGLKIVSISGTDEEATQASNATSPDPKPVAMPFQFQANGSYNSIKSLVDTLQNSIRPFQIQTLEMTSPGDTSNMNITIAAQTYYQPEKDLKITSKVVK
jgi:Tfp pilus assembly protein PilO